MKTSKIPVPLDWYIQCGMLVLAALIITIAPDTVISLFKSLYSGQPIAWTSPTAKASLQAGNFAGTELDADQVSNAAAIINKGKEMGASDRDINVALMAALQESTLKNLDHGDDWWFQQNGGGKSDSLGLFQQRDSWGSKEARLDPGSASQLFFDALLNVDHRDSLAPGDAVQKVQNSAYPDEYAKWEPVAEALLAASKQDSSIALGNASSSQIQFEVDYDSSMTADQKQAVEDAIEFWQQRIIGPAKTIRLTVKSAHGEGWLAQALPTTGQGVDVTAGDVKIDPDVFGRAEYDPNDKKLIIAHELAHVLGMTEACEMNGNSTIYVNGQQIKTGTPGHFAPGTNDLMTPSYIRVSNVDLTVGVLEKCGWQVQK
ncbi:MAG TPA: hypothetical protein V6C65_19515 [Allocoleopsis sp.]